MTQTLFRKTEPCEATSSCEEPLAQPSLLQIQPIELDAGPQTIETTPFVIGRDQACQVTIPDASVSRFHCEIRRTANGYVLTDLESTNGTFIRDREIREHPLVAGDQIRIGNRIFKFITSDHFEAQYHEAVYAMMTRDGLTGIWNKRYFMDVLSREVARAKRHLQPLALVLFDIDFFKQVNDTHGHLAGDDVLSEISSRIGAELRQDEVFARVGGEEFAILLGDVDRAEAMKMAQRCAEVVRNAPFQTCAGLLSVTISMGVAVSDPASASSPQTLLEQADQCLYHAKENGRDRVSGTPRGGGDTGKDCVG